MIKASLLSAILVAGTLLSSSAFAQNDTQTPPAASQDQNQTPATDQDKDNKKIKPKHPGGKDDVNAVGDRKLGGMNWYSIEKEIAMGRQYAEQFEKTVKLVDDPVINEYVNRVGQNLVRNSDAKVPFTIKVLDDDSINAMALPGGFFYVNSGLILAADDESEMAGAMAHEIAHVAARHATRGATKGQLLNILTLPVIMVGGVGGLAAQQALGIAMPITFVKFTKAFEAEADYLGIQYMYKAGYDPNGMVVMFEKLEAMEKKRPGTMAKIFMDHPAPPDRMAAAQQEIATILPNRDQYIVTTSEFNDVKKRLAILHNHHKITDAPSTPELRRTVSESKDPNKDDDRPILKKPNQIQ
jgi:predicted Zn-dependent protease